MITTTPLYWPNELIITNWKAVWAIIVWINYGLCYFWWLCVHMHNFSSHVWLQMCSPHTCHWLPTSLPACLTPSHSHPPWCLFGCWVLFVYCFQMADTDFIWEAFKFPERFLLPWLKRLSCFLYSGFMIGPLYIATGNNCHYQSGPGATKSKHS